MSNVPDPMPGVASGVEWLAQLRPYVRHCGNARRNAWKMGPRPLLDFLLVYIEEGMGEFTIADKTYDARPGDLFWIPPATMHSMEGYPPSMLCPYVHFDLVYRPEVSHWDFTIPENTDDLSAFQPLAHPPLADKKLEALRGRIRAHTNPRVGNLLNEICGEAARAQPYASLRLCGLMWEVLAEIMRGQEGIPLEHNEHIPLLEEAAAYARKHCEQEFSLKELAGLCGISPSYFRRLFGRHYGCAPRAYLRRARIQKAKSLMIGSGLNFSEIAQQLGFATVHSFSRAFHEVEGISPSQYRLCGNVSTRVDTRHTGYVR